MHHEPLRAAGSELPPDRRASRSRRTRRRRRFRRRRATCSTGSPSWPTSRCATSRSTGATATFPGGATADPDAGGTAFVWVHGGAFIGGDLEFPEAHWVSLAIAARGFAVLSLDYRKSLRGVHYPVPSDDILDGWLWATAARRRVGRRARRPAPRRRQRGRQPGRRRHQAPRDGAGPLPVVARARVPDRPRRSSHRSHRICRRSSPRTPRRRASRRRWSAR